MTKRTTGQWEELLDGTADGPWEVETIPEMRYYDGETWETPGKIVVYADEATLFVTADEVVGDEGDEHDNEKNVRLAAHAPEAVAEVIRLRRAITDLRDDYLAHISTRESFVDQVSGLVVEIREDVDDYYGTAARDLTRILEGDTDE